MNIPRTKNQNNNRRETCSNEYVWATQPKFKVNDKPAIDFISKTSIPFTSGEHPSAPIQENKSIIDFLKQSNEYRFNGYSGAPQSNTGRGWRYIHQHPWHSLAIGLGVMTIGISLGYFGVTMIAAGVALQIQGAALIAVAGTILAWSVGLGVLMMLLARSAAPLILALIGAAVAAATACGGIAVVAAGAIISAIGAVAGVLGTITVCASVLLILNWFVQFLRESHDEIRQWQYVKTSAGSTGRIDGMATELQQENTKNNYEEKFKHPYNNLYKYEDLT